MSGYKYPGVTQDLFLNMSDHLQKTVKNVTAHIKLLKRMRHSLSDLAVESMYKAMVLPVILYCSNPVLKVSDTMANKFGRLQRSALKIIHNQSKSCKECGPMTLLYQKSYKAAIIMFKCLQGIAILHFTSYVYKVEHKYYKRGTSSTLRLPKVRIEPAKKSLKFHGPACYNEVSVDIRNLHT